MAATARHLLHCNLITPQILGLCHFALTAVLHRSLLNISDMPVATEKLARLAGIYAGVVFGLYWIPIRKLESAGFPGLWATLLFNLMPLLVLLPLLYFRRHDFTLSNRQFHINGMLVGVSLVFYATAFVYTDVVRAVLLFYLTPIWGFILGRIFLGDIITAVRWCSVALGLGGMLVILGVDKGFPWPSNVGDWMALVSGVTWAVASLRMLMDENSNALSYCIAFFLWCSVISSALALFAVSIGVLDNADWSRVGSVAVWFLPFALLLLIPGGLAVVYSASKLNPGVVGILFMAEVCVASISAAILTDENIAVREIVGVLLVMLAGVLEPLMQWRQQTQGNDSTRDDKRNE